MRPIELHGMVMACFASLVAPFGGFFASGAKRSLNIKDFGQTIPGHGGVADRMDCQILMGLFSYVYYNSFIVVQNNALLLKHIHSLDDAQKLSLYNNLQILLQENNLISK